MNNNINFAFKPHKIIIINIFMLLCSACGNNHESTEEISSVEISWIKSVIVLNKNLDFHKHGKNSLVHYVAVKNFSSDTLIIPLTTNNRSNIFFQLKKTESPWKENYELYNHNEKVNTKLNPKSKDTLIFSNTIHGFEYDSLVLEAFHIANSYSMFFESPIGRDGTQNHVLGTQFINKSKEFRLEIIIR